MYQELKTFDFAQVSEEILHYWKTNKTFEQSIAIREGKKAFSFYEGPPSANGTPGIHHVMARTVKDIFCRYKTMQGYQVKRKGGWDTHGLPVELQVEKELGITKEDIGKKISIEVYNQKCREAVMKYTNEWNELTEKMGYWVDLEHPYITYEADYIESLWYILKQFYDKGLLYKGFTIQPYSPAAGTGLSSHELNQPGTYKNVKDTSVVAMFLWKATEHEDVKKYFLAWTTTPWTLPANTALAVGEKIVYADVETFNPYTFERIRVVLAHDLLGKYFKPEGHDADFEAFALLTDEEKKKAVLPWKLHGTCSGKELVGNAYEPLFGVLPIVQDFAQQNPKAYHVIAGDFVSTEDGTGIVHISPTFGADDKRVADIAGISGLFVKDAAGDLSPIVDKSGRYVPEMGLWAGRYVKTEYAAEKEERTLDVDLSIWLKEQGRAFKVEKYEHAYPHCWRTDKPVLYYPLESWFIKTTALKEQLVALNKTINWKPESTGSGRFGNWLENLVDWNLSRSRFWGTPLPVWRSKDGKYEKCIGSIASLKAEITKASQYFEQHPDKKPEGDQWILDPDQLVDLHRPYVDNIVLVSDTGELLFREPDLIDVWFDSGAMPYAQWHYPFENEELFEQNFPADFIAEGVDQTRGWFFTLHAISVLLGRGIAFKNVIANGLVLDKHGNKMSKRLGNAIDPFLTLKQYGPDATRWYMIANAAPWENLKFNTDGVLEVQRKFLGTLLNTYNFFALYANLDGFEYREAEIPLTKRTEADRWIISKANSLIQTTTHALNDYDPTPAARSIQDFVIDDLSNWYVRLNRKRFWKGEYNEDKIAAYQTLYFCLETVVKLSAPIAPFITEKLYLELNKVTKRNTEASVHFCYTPEANPAHIDTELEHRMHLAQKISSMVHSLRRLHKLKVRQPLSRLMIPVLNPELKTRLQSVEDLILAEVNIKKIEYLEDTTGLVTKKVKPNYKKLGKTLGEKIKAISEGLAKLSQEQIAQFEMTNQISLAAGGEQVNLTLDDVEISSEDIPGWVVATDHDITVALDLELTDELRQEGIARDVVNKVQNLRKDMGLDVQAKIKITVANNLDALVVGALTANKEYICNETQALELNVADTVANSVKVEMDDFDLVLSIETLA
jgi:isoleucyl-tRNA synthetase